MPWRAATIPLLVNTVVGFIGPEYLADGKQIIRAGLEDHFCGKLLGLPMGVDICYTNHSFADQEDMDVLLTTLAAAGVSFVITVPGADDIMLNYQSLSFHDAQFIRDTLGHPPAPEFEAWMEENGIGTPEADLPASRRAGASAPARRMSAPETHRESLRRHHRGAADLRGRGDARSTPRRRCASPSTTPARGRRCWPSSTRFAHHRGFRRRRAGQPRVTSAAATRDDLHPPARSGPHACRRPEASAGGASVPVDVALVLGDGLSGIAANLSGPAFVAALARG
jgi:hypothetical protein